MQWDEQTDLLKVQLGRCEAESLDDYAGDCYVASSSKFHVSQPDHPLYRPVCDERHVQRAGDRPQWPGGAPLAVCLTHDVDNVSLFAPSSHYRKLLKQLRYLRTGRESRALHGAQSNAVALLKSLCSWHREDPLHAFQRWLELEQRVGAKSTFLFLPDRYPRWHYTDGGYRYADRVRFDGQKCTVAEMMREIHRRGWEVGLHAGWNSWDSPDELKDQKEQVERAIDAPVTCVRHHHLHFDIRRTPRVHQQVGLQVDSSLGFNDDVGFRLGTSYPVRLMDLEQDQPLDVIELPLIIQDKCLFSAVGCGSVERAVDWGQLLARRVRDVGGVLTVLWHPGVLNGAPLVQLYERLLAMLASEGAWFGTMKEVVRHWKQSPGLDEAAA